MKQTPVGDSKNLRANPMLNRATKYLRSGIRKLEGGAKRPSVELMFAKYNLAKIEALRLPEKDILRILVEGKFSLTKTITSRKRHPEKQVMVPANLLQAVYRLQHDVLRQLGDGRAATEALREISNRTDEGDRPDNQAQYTAALVQEIKSLSKKDSINQKSLSLLKKQTDHFRSLKVEVSLNDPVWMADSVASLAKHAVNPEVSRQCFVQALDLASSVRRASNVPAPLMRTLQNKEIDWLIGANQNDQAFDRLMTRLRESPNVVEFQFKANRILEKRAIDNDSVDTLQTVMNGDRENELPLWGWAKLAASLQQLRYNRSASKPGSHQLLEAHYRLARCRWLLASVSVPNPSDSTWAKQLRRQKNAFGLLIKPDDPEESRWQTAMNNLALER